jgi:hypothetical protein
VSFILLTFSFLNWHKRDLWQLTIPKPLLKNKRLIQALLSLPSTKITDYQHLCVVDETWIMQVTGNVITKFALDSMSADDMSK